MSRNPVHIQETFWKSLDSIQLRDKLGLKIIEKEFQSKLSVILASQISMINYHQGILSVKIDNSDWKSIFLDMENELIKYLNYQYGADFIKKIKYI